MLKANKRTALDAGFAELVRGHFLEFAARRWHPQEMDRGADPFDAHADGVFVTRGRFLFPLGGLFFGHGKIPTRQQVVLSHRSDRAADLHTGILRFHGKPDPCASLPWPFHVDEFDGGGNIEVALNRNRDLAAEAVGAMFIPLR